VGLSSAAGGALDSLTGIAFRESLAGCRIELALSFMKR
jgi:hypothetical protein